MMTSSGTNKPFVVMDSAGLIALLSSADTHYKSASKTNQFIQDEDYKLVFPASVIGETVSTLIWDKRPDDAKQVLDTIISSPITIIPINHSVLKLAAAFYNEKEVKRADSFFDAIVAAVAIQLNTKFIFSYDSYFERLGLILLPRKIELKK